MEGGQGERLVHVAIEYHGYCKYIKTHPLPLRFYVLTIGSELNWKSLPGMSTLKQKKRIQLTVHSITLLSGRRTFSRVSGAWPIGIVSKVRLSDYLRITSKSLVGKQPL